MSWCGEADAVADELADIDFFACYPHPERLGWSLALGYLRGLSRARRRNVLRMWLTRCGVPVPGHRILDTIQDQVIDSRLDASPQISWSDWQCRRYQGRLYLMPQLPVVNADRIFQCTVDEVIYDSGFGELSFAQSMGEGMRLDSSKPVSIMFSREGVRCKPVGRQHSQTLKKLFQAAAIPPWLRERTPLIYQDDRLLAVGDWWICADAAVNDEEPGYLLQWAL
jgi:tRNA(Ile)-lysidine synthase